MFVHFGSLATLLIFSNHCKQLLTAKKKFPFQASTYCSTIHKKGNKIKYSVIIQLLDKCLRGNKIAPLWHAHALLCLALVSKGCNFNAPLVLIQQFLIVLFFKF